MKQTFCILIMFLISINGFAQCDDIDKLELGGTYYSRTRNYIPFEIKHKDKIEKDDTFYSFDIKKIEKYSDSGERNFLGHIFSLFYEVYQNSLR